MDAGQIIIKPIITEKSMNDVGKGKFTFLVAKDSNKKEIKKAVEEKFKVKVIGVSTIIIKGRSARVGIRRKEVKKADFKKAVVELLKGQKIDLFEAGT
ncbi:MAG: 50S ribosomal protein L23 [Candidatus Levyibacteriota bacterium]